MKKKDDKGNVSPLWGILEDVRYVRNKEVCAYLGISRASLHRWVKAGIFPAPETLGPNTKAWHMDTLLKWRADL